MTKMPTMSDPAGSRQRTGTIEMFDETIQRGRLVVAGRIRHFAWGRPVLIGSRWTLAGPVRCLDGPARAATVVIWPGSRGSTSDQPLVSCPGLAR